jgi:hypothetical protein
MVLRSVFGSKRDEVTGELRQIHNEELIDLLLLTQCCAGDQNEKFEMGGACSSHGRERGEAYAGFWCGILKERDVKLPSSGGATLAVFGVSYVQL